MPCCLLVIVLFVPRVALFVLALTGYVGRAYDTFVWPLLGFFFMPYTTCAYAVGMNENDGFQGWSLVLLIVGVVLDIGHHGGTAASRKKR
ncbi:MAG: hypothetical protein GWP08_09855 [Nitrospiraceae bacterium]|nr:hypothetical protein [Nitrospiraceae bacterium]